MIRSAHRLLAPLLIATASVSAAGFQPAATHDKAFWQAIVKNNYAVPQGQAAPALAAELSALLGSTDSELRDTYGYSILTAWIFQTKALRPADITPLVTEWLANLQAGVGATGSTAVLRRSFSALMLSVVIARDNADPFMDDARVRQVLDAGLAYIAAERDVRGYDPAVGWMHSAAHTADLLKFLARSRIVTPVDQRAILDAIAHKLTRTGEVFTHGEDERYARAVLSIVKRADVDPAAFAAWLAATRPAPAPDGPIDVAKLHGDQNVKNFLAKLQVLLALEVAPPAQVKACADAVTAALKGLF